MIHTKMIETTAMIYSFFALLMTAAHVPCLAEGPSQNERDSIKIVFSSDGPGENLVFSPHGAETIAAMMAAGAKNQTFDEIQRAFSFPANPEEIVVRSRRTRQAAFVEKNENNRLVSDNGLWIAKGMTLSPVYRERIAQGFEAHLEQCDFSSGKESNANSINQWINERTSGKIPAMTDGFAPETCMVLLNLIDFQCDWLSPFDPAKTQECDFTLPGGEKIIVPQMRQQLRCPYFGNEDVRCVLLPYAHENLAMLLVLPEKSGIFDKAGDFFSQTAIRRYCEEMDLETVDCQVPKLDWNGTVDLRPVFKQLGMNTIFDREKADFSGIVETGRLFVDQTIQKIALEVDESGTKASAASTVVFAPKSAVNATEEIMEFHADRPFFFAVMDMENKNCLFAGRCMNPEKKRQPDK